MKIINFGRFRHAAWLSAVETRCVAVGSSAISFSEKPDALEGLKMKKDAASIPHVQSETYQRN